jgi:hypothetical protein
VVRRKAPRSLVIRTSSQLNDEHRFRRAGSTGQELFVGVCPVSVLKNDDRCNVRKEAISRDVHRKNGISSCPTDPRKPLRANDLLKSMEDLESRFGNIRSRCVPHSPNLDILKRLLSVRECGTVAGAKTEHY